MRLDTELYNDGLCFMASIDGHDFDGECWSGHSGGWYGEELNLADVYGLGDLTGQDKVWIAFVFVSNESTQFLQGAFVDDIRVLKDVLPTRTPTRTRVPSITPTPSRTLTPTATATPSATSVLTPTSTPRPTSTTGPEWRVYLPILVR
jgi:hypothetical protein